MNEFDIIEKDPKQITYIDETDFKNYSLTKYSLSLYDRNIFRIRYRNESIIEYYRDFDYYINNQNRNQYNNYNNYFKNTFFDNYRYYNTHIKNNIRELKYSLSLDPNNIMFINNPNLDLILYCLDLNPGKNECFRFIDYSVLDYDIIYKYVCMNGLNIKYVFEKDICCELCLAAVVSNKDAIQYISKDLKYYTNVWNYWRILYE